MSIFSRYFRFSDATQTEKSLGRLTDQRGGRRHELVSQLAELDLSASEMPVSHRHLPPHDLRETTHRARSLGEPIRLRSLHCGTRFQTLVNSTASSLYGAGGRLARCLILTWRRFFGHCRQVTEERNWNLLVSNLQKGRCIPFLGAGACAGLLPLGPELARRWAERYGYPFEDDANLARVMQYVAVMEFNGDLPLLKEHLVQEVFHRTRLPDFGAEHQIHSLLARCDLPLYVTTNYDDFLTRSLKVHNKDPHEQISPWYAGSVSSPLPKDYTPTPKSPLVYHLHGHYRQPESMVVAEDDYIEYLIRLGGDSRTSSKRSLVPPVVNMALRKKSILFIGYSIADWTFLVLFRTLLRGLDETQRPWNVSVQLTPRTTGNEESARNYLEESFRRRNITVFWKSTEDFTKELARRMWGAAG
ncbi:SIR2 family NAD-dependent protein deacylase [Nonomuraea sp. NPDC049400]|uniref:SIR2 family NAD-dependent protein deacylase n=1 Tax=Nonomuraea sp. NPDC049400 TaxID=3364352 RepID=UPI003795B2E3